MRVRSTLIAQLGNAETGVATRRTLSFVMRGLDPRIHASAAAG
jgi:hypothetical protein